MTPVDILASIILIGIIFWIVERLKDQYPWLEAVFGIGSPLLLILLGLYRHINWLLDLGIGFYILFFALYVWFVRLIPYIRQVRKQK